MRAAGGNGASEYDYDLFTIGAGSGGVRATRFASANYGVSHFLLMLYILQLQDILTRGLVP